MGAPLEAEGEPVPLGVDQEAEIHLNAGYGIASLAVGVVREGVGLSLGSIYGGASALAVIMAVLGYAVRGAEPSVTASHP